MVRFFDLIIDYPKGGEKTLREQENEGLEFFFYLHHLPGNKPKF